MVMVINSDAPIGFTSLSHYCTSSCFILVSIFIEIIFYLVFKLHLKRKANDIRYKTIKPYRDYGKKRHLLFKRILDRIEARCKLENKDIDIELHTFLRNWFHPSPVQSSVKCFQEERFIRKTTVSYPSLDKRGTSISSSSSSSKSDMDGINHDNNSHTNSSMFCKEDLLEFFTWAFFDKRYVELKEDWEREELTKIFEMLSSRYGFVYQSYTNNDSNHVRMKPKCMTLEKCKPLHRPLALYGLFFVIRMTGYLVLYLKGFRRYTIDAPVPVEGGHCKRKMLCYWLLDKPRHDKDHPSTPILFFHGIAPAGLSFYIPMLLKSIVGDGSNHNRPIFLFENLPITCSLVFNALTEEETIFCVDKALLRHEFIDLQRNNMILVGHSFGSFQSTWLLKSPLLSKNIQKVILLDPVSILLSEPDVVTNFLYKRTADAFDNNRIKGEGGSVSYSFVELLNRLKIRLLASSELGIEWYLRRNFAWYNSELWIEDIRKGTEISVFVSELDEIIDPEKVMNETSKFPNVKLNLLKDVGHAAVLTRSYLWSDLSKEFEDTVNLNGGSKTFSTISKSKNCKGKME